MQFRFEFRDGAGTIQGTGRTKGNWFFVELNGVRFDGMTLDGLVPRPGRQEGISRFTIDGGCLCECQLIAEFPVRVLVDQGETLATLSAVMTIGSYDHAVWEDPEYALALGITLKGVHYETIAETDSFEEELVKLQASLPENSVITTCFFCQLSGYHPMGRLESSGNLACFRDVAEEYVQVRTEEELESVWDRHTELVQEIDLCNSFQLRTVGHGGRSIKPLSDVGQRCLRPFWKPLVC